MFESNGYTTYLNEQIEQSQNKEKEAFHALMKLIAPANQDEAITLYVQATQATFWEGYHKGRQVSQNQTETAERRSIRKADTDEVRKRKGRK